jgi:hypothetical protein
MYDASVAQYNVAISANNLLSITRYQSTHHSHITTQEQSQRYTAESRPAAASAAAGKRGPTAKASGKSGTAAGASGQKQGNTTKVMSNCSYYAHTANITSQTVAILLSSSNMHYCY